MSKEIPSNKRPKRKSNRLPRRPSAEERLADPEPIASPLLALVIFGVLLAIGWYAAYFTRDKVETAEGIAVRVRKEGEPIGDDKKLGVAKQKPPETAPQNPSPAGKIPE
jgi:hypothetical protein